MKPARPTIFDLAALANVSASTVSAVLHGNWRERRISAATAERVRQIADAHEYMVNRQASGLRKSRSGLIGMMIPMHDNRFFSGMSQTFERLARLRGWYPLVVSTLRDPVLEVETARTLISYRVEHLVIAGATDPDAVGRVCRSYGVEHVNVDLPGTMAASVISDNYWGAQQLARALVKRAPPPADARRDRIHFLGGIVSDYATKRRIEGFVDVVARLTGPLADDQVDACGYEADLAEMALRRLCERRGGLPRGLFINSTIALEGVVRVLKTLSAAELAGCVFGCYDWDPFAGALSFPLLMVRQNADELLEAAFRMIDDGTCNRRRTLEIRPALVFPELLARSGP
jgi:LacI family fructose operon transcriptional repressor